MPLKPELLKLLDRSYTPNSIVELRYKRLDLAVRTDGDGLPFQLFLGKRGPEGRVLGDRYMRHRTLDGAGAVVKDHWDRKGKAT